MIVTNYAPNYSVPYRHNFIQNISIITQIIYNCTVRQTNITQWSLYQYDPLTGERLIQFNLSSNPTSVLPNLNIKNGTLKYGFYEFTLNFTLITTDETVSPFVAILTTYIRVVPTGFIVSGFPIDWGELPMTFFTVSPSDSISFIPAFYSYDTDDLAFGKTLYYQFYCMLVDKIPKTNLTNNITDELFSVKPNVDLTTDQLNSGDTCFKDPGTLITYTE